MTTVTVFTAGNPGYWNPGMLTVDLACHEFLQSVSTDIKVRWCLPYDSKRIDLQSRRYVDASSLPFGDIPVIGPDANQFDDAAAIIYWGDFLQARHYIVDEAALRVREANPGITRDGAIRHLANVLLLATAPESLVRRSFLVGGTILHNRQSDYLDPLYGPAFTRLIAQAKAVWMRDVVSAAKVAHVRNTIPAAEIGLDCAFFLTDECVDKLPASSWIDSVGPKHSIGVFLGGRTPLSASIATRFLAELSEETGLPLDWLPWFGFSYPQYVPPVASLINPRAGIEYRIARRAAKSFMRETDTYSFGDLLHALRRYRFVVTDTYHVCVNSWRAGTPAICISSSNPLGIHDKAALSLSDFKKAVLYSMYDAMDFYIQTDALLLKNDRAKTIQNIVACVNNQSLIRGVTEKIRRHRDSVHSHLRSQLLQVLGS